MSLPGPGQNCRTTEPLPSLPIVPPHGMPHLHCTKSFRWKHIISRILRNTGIHNSEDTEGTSSFIIHTDRHRHLHAAKHVTQQESKRQGTCLFIMSCLHHKSYISSSQMAKTCFLSNGHLHQMPLRRDDESSVQPVHCLINVGHQASTTNLLLALIYSSDYSVALFARCYLQ